MIFVFYQVSQMILTGHGHSDWLSGCIFHPDGTKLATTSGDRLVRFTDGSSSPGSGSPVKLSFYFPLVL